VSTMEEDRLEIVEVKKKIYRYNCKCGKTLEADTKARLESLYEQHKLSKQHRGHHHGD